MSDGSVQPDAPDTGAPQPVAMHPDLAPLAGLLGEWEGTGRGVYPTIEPFAYRERVTFAHAGKPFLVYGQRTHAADDGRPLHVETGYWRVARGLRVELVIAHPTGITEVAEGRLEVDGDDDSDDDRDDDRDDDSDDGSIVIDVRSTAIGLTATAKSVTAIERTFRLSGHTLDYSVRMAAVGQPLQHHLAASLRRVDAP